MKRILLAAAVVALTGCSSLAQVTNPGAHFKEKSLKDAYKKETGENLPEPEIGPLCFDYACYTEAWQTSFDKSIKIYRDNKQAIQAFEESARQKEILEQERICNATPGCMKDREIAKHKNVTYQAYNYFTVRYAMNSDEYDYISRKMCDGAIAAQSKGTSLNQLVGMVTTTPGGDGADRMFIMELAKSCWYLGSLGITSSKDALPHREI